MASAALLEQRTVEYRQVASCLASAAVQKARKAATQEEGTSLDMLPSMRASQHLLCHHPGWIPKRILLQEEDANNTQSPKDAPKNKDQDICLPCCVSCGGPLQPGLWGCTVRLVPSKKRPSRTQRRRLSRKTAVKKKTSAQQNSRTQTKALSQLGVYVHTNFATVTMEPPRMMRPAPSENRNILKLACACGAKTTLPGFSRKPRRQLKQPPNSQKKAAVASSTIDHTLDFLSLRTIKQQPSDKAAGKRVKKRKGTISSTASLNRDSKNQLMDFLSSLNDH